MAIASGTYTLGPDDGELLVRTGRSGAAAKAGHDLIIEVASWNATLEIAPDASQSRLELTADGGSMRVREGTGGITALGDDDKDGIRKTIDDEVLRRSRVRFASTSIEDGDRCLHVQGELELLGRRAPITFDVTQGDGGRVTASAVITQTKWGMKPYSTLFGTLKVADDVEVTFAGTLR